MREEIHYRYARFMLAIDSDEKSFVLYGSGNKLGVVANKRFDNEVDFKEAMRSLNSKLQALNDKIKEIEND